MNYTNIEQSKKLLELGLNPGTADFCYRTWMKHDLTPLFVSYTEGISILESSIYDVSARNKLKMLVPCWSIGALLEVMPKQIFSEDHIKHYVPTLYIAEKASIGYQAMNEFLCIKNGKTLIEAIYDMVVWLLENNYIKKVFVGSYDNN